VAGVRTRDTRAVTASARVRPQWNPAYVWCDYHGEIHLAEEDFYGEGMNDEFGCVRANWRKVYVMGTSGEFLL
jgi:hypothetical protein